MGLGVARYLRLRPGRLRRVDYLAWRNRNTVRVPAKVSPAEVALPNVSAAIASSSGRIDAIRRLRQMYPGLGLLDAKELVDRQLPGPG